MSLIWTEPNPFDSWKPETQCFGQYATDELGIETTPTSDTAARWCAMGWMRHQEIPATITSGFARWILDHYQAQPITVLNDVNGWRPIDFAFAWDKYVIDLNARPKYYLG